MNEGMLGAGSMVKSVGTITKVAALAPQVGDEKHGPPTAWTARPTPSDRASAGEDEQQTLALMRLGQLPVSRG